MRKGTTIAGAVAVVAVVGGLGVSQWIKGRAVSEVRRSIAGVRNAGATIEHGPVQFDIWSRTLRIDDIKFVLPGEKSTTRTIARVRAEGIALFARDFQAARVDLTGIDLQQGVPGTGDLPITMKVPTVVLMDFAMPGTPPAIAANADKVTVAGAYLEQIRAGSISIEKLEASVKLPQALFAPPPGSRMPPPSNLDQPVNYTYSDIKLERLSDGRIANATAGKMAFNGPTGGGTIDGMTVTNIDMLPFFRIGLDRRKPVDGYYVVQGETTIGTLSMSLPDGAQMTMGKVRGSGFAIDPAKVSFQTMSDLFANMPATGQRMSVATNAGLLDQMAKLYEGIRIDEVMMRELRIRGGAIPSSSVIRIGAIAMQGLVGGKLGLMRLDDFTVPVPGAPGRPGAPGPATGFKIGSAAILGFDIVRTMRLGATVSQPGRLGAQPSSGEVLGMFEGIEIQKTSIPDLGSGAIDVDDMRLGWGQIAGGVPGTLRMLFKGRIPVNPRDPNHAPLRALGMTSIDGEFELASRFEPARQQVTLDVSRFRIEKIGALSGKLELGNVTPGTYAMIPTNFGGVTPQFTLKMLDLRLADAGAIQAFYVPATATMPPGAGPIAQLKQKLIDPGQPGGNLGALLDAVDRFMDTPGQTLALKLIANDTVRLGEFTDSAIAAAPGPLARLMERFAVDARVTK